MNKISQKQIDEAAEAHANGMFSRGTYSASEIFKKAIGWYRIREVELLPDKLHPDRTNISELTSSRTIKLHVDNWPEILEFLRVYHPYRYEVYRDNITIFCDSKKHLRKMEVVIDFIRSIKESE